MWRRWLAILAIVALAVALIGLVEIFSLATESQPYGKPQSHNQYQPVYASLVQLLLGWWSWLRTRLDHDTISTLAIVATACFTGTLWWSTKRLWESSQIHAGHAEAALRISERTAERQLRAYVHVYDVHMALMNSGHNPNIRVIIKNYGQTPARNITNTFKCNALDAPAPEAAFNLRRADIYEIPDLAPSQQVFSSLLLPIDYWASIRNDLVTRRREFSFYVFGRIDYRDIFGEPRFAEYRFTLPIDLDGIPDESSLVMYGHTGNRTT